MSGTTKTAAALGSLPLLAACTHVAHDSYSRQSALSLSLLSLVTQNVTYCASHTASEKCDFKRVPRCFEIQKRASQFALQLTRDKIR